jgi:hypothetical protein
MTEVSISDARLLKSLPGQMYLVIAWLRLNNSTWSNLLSISEIRSNFDLWCSEVESQNLMTFTDSGYPILALCSSSRSSRQGLSNIPLDTTRQARPVTP